MAESIEVAAAILGDLAASATRRSARSRPTGSAGRRPCSASSCPTNPTLERRRDRRCRESGSPSLVLGRGSNLLVADGGFDGLAVMLGDAFADGRDRRHVGARRGSGGLPVVARRTAAAGLRGFEWAVGVPGSIGGAVRMNAGGHGSDMAAVARAGSASSTSRSGKDVVVSAAELDLGYRHSAIWPTADVVVWRGARAAPRRRGRRRSARSPSIVRWRRENQPGGQNAGSVFTNPPGDSAGRLIDAAGLQGAPRAARRMSPRSTPTSSRPMTEGPPTTCCALMHAVVERSPRARRGSCLRPEVRLVGLRMTHGRRRRGGAARRDRSPVAPAAHRGPA